LTGLIRGKPFATSLAFFHVFGPRRGYRSLLHRSQRLHSGIGTENPSRRWRVGRVISFLIFRAMPTSHVRRTSTFPITVRPTEADILVARRIARNAAPVPEQVARALTWGADEKVLLVLAAAGWLASRGRSEPAQRACNHALLVTVAASLIPHGLKLLFDQTRPDRRTVIGHVHGASFSGKREDAFPSGHALHMGALASAAGGLRAGTRRTIRALAVGLALTRIFVLAHWASDVVVGFALGVVLERLLRVWTGYPFVASTEKHDADP
jgi:hypothetical protein